MSKENNEIKILKGNEGYRIVEASGYDYEHSGSIENLGCIFKVDEKELISIIDKGKNEIVYFDFNKNEHSNKENYLKNYNNEDLYITPLVTFSTYEKAEEVLNWLSNR